MRIIFISDFNKHTTSLFSKVKILKCIDFIQMQNCIFVNKSGSGSLYSLFSQTYLFANDHHNYNTKFSSNGLINMCGFICMNIIYISILFIYLIIFICIFTWSYSIYMFLVLIENKLLHCFSPKKNLVCLFSYISIIHR